MKEILSLENGTTLEQSEPDSIYFVTYLEKEIDFELVPESS
jgi:hypothetical protein